MYSHACLRQRLWAYVFLALSNLNHFLLRLGCGVGGGGVFLVSRSWYLSLTTAVRHSESKREWRKNTCHTETYLSSWDSAHPWEARLNPDKRIWCKAHPVLRTERKLGTVMGSHNDWEPPSEWMHLVAHPRISRAQKAEVGGQSLRPPQLYDKGRSQETKIRQETNKYSLRPT